MNRLYESLLDTASIESGLNNTLAEDWINKYAKVDGKIIYLKNGDIKVHGDLIISGFDGEELPSLNIKEFKGDLIIERCKKITGLKDWFKTCVCLDGAMSVSNCDKLTSLAGCPNMVAGPFNVTGNKSLKSLDGMPDWVQGNIYIMKNGKRFTEQEVLNHLDQGLLPGKKLFV